MKKININTEEDDILLEDLDKRNEEFAVRLFNLRKAPCCKLPNKNEVEIFADELLMLMFPHFSDKNFKNPDDIKIVLSFLEKKLCHIITPLKEKLEDTPQELAEMFFSHLPDVYDQLILDAESITRNDPAARNVDEVILTYPGFLAISIYRIAHVFNNISIPLFPRVLTEYAHRLTGIDIHPAAAIGSSFCIDHGTGIVIGETTVIGDNVKIYQGVTLGALSVKKSLSKTKRHPTIEDNVVIYSNATILGGKTIIGHDSTIGGNVWLTTGVPPYSIVYHQNEIKLSNTKNENAINFII
jgi:serine O-acetyltransferase